MKILTEDWTPTEETLKVLKLNQMPDAHIAASLQFLKSKYVNTSIDAIDGYNSWSELFIVFCIKAFDEVEKKGKGKPDSGE